MKCLVNFNSLCHSLSFWWQITFNSPRGESQSPSSYHIRREAQALWIVTAGWSLHKLQMWLLIGWLTYDVTHPSSSIPTPTVNGEGQNNFNNIPIQKKRPASITGLYQFWNSTVQTLWRLSISGWRMFLDLNLIPCYRKSFTPQCFSWLPIFILLGQI